MKINTHEISFRFKFRDDINFPATMTVVIGQFEIRGFTVRKSKFEDANQLYAVFPPSKNVGGPKWLHLFYTPDKKEWVLFEKVALEKFKKEQDRHLLDQVEEETSWEDVSKVL